MYTQHLRHFHIQRHEYKIFVFYMLLLTIIIHDNNEKSSYNRNHIQLLAFDQYVLFLFHIKLWNISKQHSVQNLECLPFLNTNMSKKLYAELQILIFFNSQV